MKRYGLLVLTLALLMASTAVSAALFPGPQIGLFPTRGDGLVTAHLQMGWFNGIPVWYICTDTNNIGFAQTQHLTLTPNLIRAFPLVTGAIYIVTNPPASQGPIFSSIPPQARYTGVWYVEYVTFAPGATKIPLTSTTQILALNLSGQLLISPTSPRIVLDCPILVVGSLGAPIYKIPEGVNLNYAAATIQLPFYNVYCQNPITRAISVQRVIVTESSNLALAAALGANPAPILHSMAVSDRGLMFAVNPLQDINPVLPGIQPLKVLANQLPVKCDCPNPCGPSNTNFDYSPVESIVFLNRLFPSPAFPMLPETLFNNCPFIEAQIGLGNLIPVAFPTPPLPAAPIITPFPPIHSSADVNAPFVCGQF